MTAPPPTGLRDDGTLAREGDPRLIPRAFLPPVEALRTGLPRVFGDRMHSAYLYGSIPRGTATPHTSDLDALVLLHTPPTPTDHDRARVLMNDLDAAFPVIDGGAILLDHTGQVLRPLTAQDGGFFVSCLCTPLIGPDLATRLPAYRPTTLLARQTNGDLHLVLPRWRQALERARTDADLTALARRVGRRLVRTGFTLIMPTWGGWTSDLSLATDLFAHHHPAQATVMRRALAAAEHPTPDPDLLRSLLDRPALWLEATYTRTHGRRTSPRTVRPAPAARDRPPWDAHRPGFPV
ncbi:nucleotidyltransferase domain-containing protein [Nocardiopsis sp. MG754419]|uniref:nucleotidyltransferase domain-containing protein n=1 Tax=Nocardiopsis sp. MG754419 TaxID=2259865 RepID=UPI001BADC9B3|nr:nucleotidyltransferase domain-containing protein [Nocardiopsis sp. MG754419]